MIFILGGHLEARETLIYGCDEIRVTHSYKYLGMTFTAKLSINSILSEVCRKGKKGVMDIQKSMTKFNTIDPTLFWKLFDTQIEPILTYSSEVCGL